MLCIIDATLLPSLAAISRFCLGLSFPAKGETEERYLKQEGGQVTDKQRRVVLVLIRKPHGKGLYVLRFVKFTSFYYLILLKTYSNLQITEQLHKLIVTKKFGFSEITSNKLLLIENLK